ETTEAKILIDSGAKELLIGKQFCQKQKIPLQKIDRFIPVFNIDGMANEGGKITDKTCLLIRMTNDKGDYHNKQCELLVTNLERENVILETGWLYEHNLQIDWVKNCLMFSSCTAMCIVSQSKFTI
ncbi:hypothetical protein HETIRDRAFT_49154, partial [Heterobasidion irregulare TC 32-1]